MPSKLAGKTIILTGTSIVKSVTQLIEDNGGTVKHFPLIETAEKVSDEDLTWLQKLAMYDWLIFTSQNAVVGFVSKCERHAVDVAALQIKIAAVGDKTAKALRDSGLQVHFMPSVFSADVFVQQFVMEDGERALFLRGSLAKSTIHDSTEADEWTVYETRTCQRYIEAFEQCLQEANSPIIIFASPSAVEVYAQKLAPNFGWDNVTFCSIGHITTAALEKYGVSPIQPKIYTMQAVIEQLILEETIK